MQIFGSLLVKCDKNKQVNILLSEAICEIYINHFTYLFLLQKDISVDDIVMQKSEVSAITFVNKKQYINLLNNGDMVEAIKYCNELLKYIK